MASKQRGTVTRYVLLHEESGCYWNGRAFVAGGILQAAQYLSEAHAKGIGLGLETPTTVVPFTGTLGITIWANGNDPRPSNLPERRA